MIIQELLQLLMTYEPLVTLLKINEEKVNGHGKKYLDPKIYPFATEEIQDCITCKFVPLVSDGVKEQSRLELTCISQDMLRAIQILETVKACLLTVGDTQKTDAITEISLNGGSSPLENETTGTVHIKAHFTIKNIYQ